MSLICRKTEFNLFTRNKVPSRIQKESSANLLFENKLAGEKGGKEGAKKDSKGDEDETASVTSYESSMVSRMQWLSILEFINKKGGYPEEPVRTQRKTSKPPKARENAGNQVVIGVICYLIGWDSGASFLDQSQSNVINTKAIPDYLQRSTENCYLYYINICINLVKF